MEGQSATVLTMLLIAYGIGILWVIGLLWLTVMKFAGAMRIERPRWIFGSVHRAMAVCLFSAALLIGLDVAMKSLGVL